jgi:hypothetical protein
MGLTDFLKKAGVLVDETKPETVETAKVSTVVTETTKTVGNTATSDEAIKSQLITSFEQSKVAGKIDYLDFRKTLSRMKASNLSDKDKFQTIYDTLSATFGLTKQDLSQSVDKYLEIAKKEKAEFDAEITKQINVKVKSIDDKIINSNKQIEIAKAKIEELNKSIANEEAQISASEIEKESIISKIETTTQKFNATITETVAELETDKTNINTYIS